MLEISFFLIHIFVMFVAILHYFWMFIKHTVEIPVFFKENVFFLICVKSFFHSCPRYTLILFSLEEFTRFTLTVLQRCSFINVKSPLHTTFFVIYVFSVIISIGEIPEKVFQTHAATPPLIYPSTNVCPGFRIIPMASASVIFLAEAYHPSCRFLIWSLTSKGS